MRKREITGSSNQMDTKDQCAEVVTPKTKRKKWVLSQNHNKRYEDVLVEVFTELGQLEDPECCPFAIFEVGTCFSDLRRLFCLLFDL